MLNDLSAPTGGSSYLRSKLADSECCELRELRSNVAIRMYLQGGERSKAIVLAQMSFRLYDLLIKLAREVVL
jgi:hypothetical protein